MREPQRERAIAFGQRFAALRRSVDQVGRVRQPRLRRGEVGPFRGRDIERRELASPRVEELAFGGRRLRHVGGRRALFYGGAPRAIAVRYFARERREAAEGVDEVALRFGLRERLMRVLAVQVDEPLAQVLQVRQRRRPAVDPRAASPLRVEDPAQQHFVPVAGELLLGQPGIDRWCVAGVEHRREFGALGARAQLAQFEAVAQQQRQRVEENRLARAGLACQDREAAFELDVEGGNDDKIANREKAQHQ